MLFVAVFRVYFGIVFGFPCRFGFYINIMYELNHAYVKDLSVELFCKAFYKLVILGFLACFTIVVGFCFLAGFSYCFFF